MPELFNHFFAYLCGQNLDHTWAPGGSLLPCCERCTGLYVGACVAAILHLWLRPKLTGRCLEIHGLFLLLMVPFGFHWLPQGALIRTTTGALFGFGIVTFLCLPFRFATGLAGRAGWWWRKSEIRNLKFETSPERMKNGSCKNREGSISSEAASSPECCSAATDRLPSALYWMVLALTLLLLPLLGGCCSKFAAQLLSAMAFVGAAALGALSVGALRSALLETGRLFRKPAHHQAQL